MRPDEILLLDMLLAARDAVDFAQDISAEQLQTDRMRQMALVKCIEIVGEAASRISDEWRAAHPQLPWGDIIGMRHRLVHDYFEIDLDRVWRTTQEHLPHLIAVLEGLVPPEES